MTILVDTSILVDHLRGDPAAFAALDGAFDGGQRVVACVLTKIEVLAGMRTREEKSTRALLGRLEWVPVDDAIAERAGALARRFLRSHPGVDPVDYAIAATAESLGASLWTRNRKHFPMFPDLPDPYAG